jgi:hypothetical protein
MDRSRVSSDAFTPSIVAAGGEGEVNRAGRFRRYPLRIVYA